MKTEEMIEVMQAYVDGKTIELRRRDNNEVWRVVPSVPYWDWHSQEYRIKPREPREFIVALNHQGFPIGVGTSRNGNGMVPLTGDVSKDLAATIVVREVLP